MAGLARPPAPYGSLPRGQLVGLQLMTLCWRLCTGFFAGARAGGTAGAVCDRPCIPSVIALWGQTWLQDPGPSFQTPPPPQITPFQCPLLPSSAWGHWWHWDPSVPTAVCPLCRGRCVWAAAPRCAPVPAMARRGLCWGVPWGHPKTHPGAGGGFAPITPHSGRLQTPCSSRGSAGQLPGTKTSSQTQTFQGPVKIRHPPRFCPPPSPKPIPGAGTSLGAEKRHGQTGKPVPVAPPAPTAGSRGWGGVSERDLLCR